MCPWLPEGPPRDPMGPCSHPRAPGFLGPWQARGPWKPGPLIAWGPPGDLEAPSRAGGPLLGEILGAWRVPSV